MGTSGMGTCSKILLVTFNIIFWLVGLALLGVGIWIAVDRTSLELLQALESPIFMTVAYAMIALGAVIFIIGFFGCAGACCESKCMLWTYFSFMLLLLVLEIIAAILVFVFQSEIEMYIEKQFNATFIDEYGQGNEATTLAVDTLQYLLNCCGVNSYEDWTDSQWYYLTKNQTLPPSCCTTESTLEDLLVENNPSADNYTACQGQDVPLPNEYMYQEGCYDALLNWLQDNIWIIGGVAIAVAVVEVLGMLLVICLVRNLDGDDED